MKFCSKLKKSAVFLLETQSKTMVLLENSEMLKVFASRRNNYMSVFGLKMSMIFLFLWQFYCFLPSEQLHFQAIITRWPSSTAELLRIIATLFPFEKNKQKKSFS